MDAHAHEWNHFDPDAPDYEEMVHNAKLSVLEKVKFTDITPDDMFEVLLTYGVV